MDLNFWSITTKISKTGAKLGKNLMTLLSKQDLCRLPKNQGTHTSFLFSVCMKKLTFWVSPTITPQLIERVTMG
jgi:hypothetical protein